MKEPRWKNPLKYFLHGISFSVLLFLLTFVWVFISVVLVAIGSFIGFIIGFIVLFIFIGGLNTFLTGLIWDISIEKVWKSLLIHGFVLFIMLIIVSLPVILINLIVPSLTTQIVVLIVYAFIDGFVAKKVGSWWEESTYEPI